MNLLLTIASGRRMRARFILAIGLVLAGAAHTAAEDQAADDSLLKQARHIFAPLPDNFATQSRPVKPEQAELGRMLFYEPRASVDGTTSCSRCHLAALYGTDGLPKSHGARNNILKRNAPTVFNAAIQFKAHWDGVNDDVEMQAHRSLTGPGFGNPDSQSGLARLARSPVTRSCFSAPFPTTRSW